MKEKILDIDSAWAKGRLYLVKHAKSIRQYNKILKMNENPIIIGGCGRSGTTLLLSMLSCHPSIYSIPKETNAFAREAYQKNPPEVPTIRVERIYRHLCSFQSLQEKTRWCEKTPKNVVYLSYILDYFGPGARFIHIVRDGRDVITSKHPDGDGFWVPPSRWINDVMHGYQHRNHDQVITVRYEDLTRDKEQVLRRLCDFLDEPYVEAFEHYPESATLKQNRAWGEKEARKVDAQSVRRWEADEYQDIVEKLMGLPGAQHLLEHYGYL